MHTNETVIASIVMKFGGTSVADADAIRRLMSIVVARAEQLDVPPVVVVSATSGTTDQLLATDEGTRLVRAIMQEVVAAARADGVEVPAESPEKKIQLTRNIRPYMTSTQIDRRQGKPMEIDAIFTKPVQIAHAKGLKVHLLELLDFSLRQLDVTTR